MEGATFFFITNRDVLTLNAVEDYVFYVSIMVIETVAIFDTSPSLSSTV